MNKGSEEYLDLLSIGWWSSLPTLSSWNLLGWGAPPWWLSARKEFVSLGGEGSGSPMWRKGVGKPEGNMSKLACCWLPRKGFMLGEETNAGGRGSCLWCGVRGEATGDLSDTIWGFCVIMFTLFNKWCCKTVCPCSSWPDLFLFLDFKWSFWPNSNVPSNSWIA